MTLQWIKTLNKMENKEHDEKLEKLDDLEERLIREIGITGNIELMELFISWQEIRAELNEHSVAVWEELISKGEEIVKESGKLTCRVLLRQLNKEYLDDGRLAISENELMSWFEKGLHRMKYSEFDTI